MNSLAHSLHDHPPAMLRAIAEVNEVALSSNAARAMVEQLVSALSDSAQLQAILAACSAQALQALAELVRDGGQMPWTAFERHYGTIRLLGPGRIERESPQRAPASIAEELWYRGLVFRAFSETPAGLAEFLYVPTDLAALLPQPGPQPRQFQLTPAALPRQIDVADERLLHDACALLCFIQAGRAKLAQANNPLAWHATSLYELNGFLLRPAAQPADLVDLAGGDAVTLVLALAHDLGWLRAERFRLTLHARPVRSWLEAERELQWRALLNAWRASTTWNDLCRIPSLHCEDTGSWTNDPVGTRARLLPLLAQLSPDTWYGVADFVAAVRREAPDFQRSDGIYDTWYVRRRAEQKYLRGFECWDDVEGELLRFLLTGPLHWLGVVDLGHDEPVSESGLSGLFRLRESSLTWLAGAPAEPMPSLGRIEVLADFTIVVPADAPLQERFRMARFTTWEPGGPPFRYRITQNGLRRAAAQGITADQVLGYLRQQVQDALPANVLRGLERWRDQHAPPVGSRASGGTEPPMIKDG